MIHTIENMKNNLVYHEGKTLISLNGYAFIDELGCCIIIVYGESNRDKMSEYLSNDNSESLVNIKYKNIKLK